LLTKLQIVELNEKDAQDALYLLSAYPVGDGDEPETISVNRVSEVVANDWGWWRTVTMNLDRISELARGLGSHLVPPDRRFDPLEALERLRKLTNETPKSLRWRIKAKVGDRKRWYMQPEEVRHD
jgi:hypothetical protein